MTSLSNYIDELKNDCVVDDINLKESALMLPAKKAKWVSRLILEKNNLNRLEKEKKNRMNSVMEKLKKEAVVTISVPVLKNLSEKDESVIEIDTKIEDSKNMIDFLERVEKVMSSMSFDIGNIVKIVQLETT
jgi:superfamily II DNA helicase RecQ